MNLQISSRLAIFALLELAVQPDRQVSVAEIGKKYGISSHHLAKVMRALSRAGLVHAVRGAGGGYQFSGNPRRTTLLDVIRLFETMGPANTRVGAAERTAAARALRELLGEIDDIARATLGSVTLATMLKLVERQRAPGRRTAAGARSASAG
ncbi:MAG TPA: Rrf2 family transcriptional regulator [Xanthobacteraceae bacterium]|nr:Rrf2 family transcriptional regulator [Xanthobacteraceae bacterium]